MLEELRFMLTFHHSIIIKFSLQVIHDSRSYEAQEAILKVQ
jgi:hypothetical protein